MKELTSRHWRLYELLKENEGKWISQLFIFNSMRDFYKEYGVNENNFHDSFVRVRIGRDILDLNNSDMIHKLILTGNRGVKIATKEEYERWSNLKWASIKRMIKRLAWKDHKAGRDGQMKLKFDDKSKAKDFYESFVEDKEIDYDQAVEIFRVIGKFED